MIFVYKVWENFCRKLHEKKIHSICAKDVFNNNEKYLVLKHDVETDVARAYEMAKIEYKYGHRGVYYVQAYLLSCSRNIEILKKIESLGHEVSYHYDVMDACKGNIDEAIKEFEKNLKIFKDVGFSIYTLCQHGNPIIERVGYTSNRDFFRNTKVQKLYPNLSDIMVDFKVKAKTEYIYFSDAGRQFKLIFDPINNDIVKSDEKNLCFDNLDELIPYIEKNNCFISTHPHRWTKSAKAYVIKMWIFKVVKKIAKTIVKVPFMKRIMSRYYYLAKKI